MYNSASVTLRKMRSLLSILAILSCLWCAAIPFMVRYHIVILFDLNIVHDYIKILIGAMIGFLAISMLCFLFVTFGWTIKMQLKTLNIAFFFFTIANILFTLANAYSFYVDPYEFNNRIPIPLILFAVTLIISVIFIFFYFSLKKYCKNKKKYWNR